MPYPSDKRWYAVNSKPQKEVFAQFHLSLKGVESFFPRVQLPEFARKRRTVVALFPNYFFVRIDLASEYDYVRWAPGVKSLVSFGGVPAQLDDRSADYLMGQANPEGIIAAHSDLQVGKQVQICAGPFEGVLGVVQRTPDARGRVRLLMQLLSRQMSIEVPAHLVASGWVVDKDRLNDRVRAGLSNRPESAYVV
jgi:transcription antitermination factor NusG